MNTSLSTSLIKGLLIAFLLIGGFYIARSVLEPFVIATFLCVLVLPITKWLERLKLNRALASLITVLLLIILVLGIFSIVASQFRSFSKELPVLLSNPNSLIADIKTRVGQQFDTDISTAFNTMVESSGESMLGTGGKILSDVFGYTTDILGFIGLLPIYMVFILWYRGKFSQFFNALSKRSDLSDLNNVVDKALGSIQSYLAGLSLVVFIIMVLNTIGLYALGIEYALFLGMLAGLLTVVPYIGIIIGAILPMTVALLTKDSYWYVAGVGILFGTVQFLEGNFITPRIVGSQVNINPLAAIFALICGSALWGIPGMIIAIPFAATLKIVLEHIDAVKPFAILLEDTSDTPPDK